MKFVSMLDEELLLDHIPGNSREEVYSWMLDKLALYAELELDKENLVAAMCKHEDAAGTLLDGLAMPHVRDEKLNDLYIVVGLPENPSAVNGKVVFMTLIGENMSDIYLKVISTLARFLSKPECAAEFILAADTGKTAFWDYLQKSDIKLRNVVCAEDVMSPADVFLQQSAPLSKAFDLFNSTHRRFLPVVNSAGELVGELSARKVVRSFFPEYVFMMENLNFLNDFAVFNEIFQSEHSLPVAQYMDHEPPCAHLDTPLVQLTLLLTKTNAGNVYVVDKEKHLKGIFSIDNVISKVLRG